MDPAFSELLSSAGAAVSSWVLSFGAQSCDDIRWLWPTLDSCLCEFDCSTVDREDILRLQRFWEICAARSDLHRAADVISIVDSRSDLKQNTRAWQPEADTSSSAFWQRLRASLPSGRGCVLPRLLAEVSLALLLL